MADPSKSTEDLLFEAMDRQALRFIEMLDNEENDKEGLPLVSMEMKLKVFDKGQEWLTKRLKLRPPTADQTEGPGVKMMRDWISDPSSREMIRTMFEHDLGVVVVPDKKAGRPTKAEAERRARYQHAKESIKNGGEPPPDIGWQKMLTEKS